MYTVKMCFKVARCLLRNTRLTVVCVHTLDEWHLYVSYLRDIISCSADSPQHYFPALFPLTLYQQEDGDWAR